MGQGAKLQCCVDSGISLQPWAASIGQSAFRLTLLPSLLVVITMGSINSVLLTQEASELAPLLSIVRRA
jgi:hypothetical protein